MLFFIGVNFDFKYISTVFIALSGSKTDYGRDYVLPSWSVAPWEKKYFRKMVMYIVSIKGNVPYGSSLKLM